MYVTDEGIIIDVRAVGTVPKPSAILNMPSPITVKPFTKVT